MTDRDQLFYLFDRYMQKTCTPAEKQEFFRLLTDPSYEERFRQISESYDALPTNHIIVSPQTSEAVWKAIRQGIPFPGTPVRRMAVVRRWWAAAAVLLFIVFGLWFVVGRRASTNPPLAVTPTKATIVPGTDGAILTLADGRTVVLDSSSNGNIAQQGSVAITKQGNQLVYDVADSALQAAGPLVFNTMTTPRGKQFKLVLPDGTKVWLNAASSLRYPAVFAAQERRVEVTGEAYFEVSPLPVPTGREEKVPFIVKVNNGPEIEVLGTHFNVNAYTDEPAMTTTLLEGRVKVSAAGVEPVLLRPDQECVLQDGKERVNEVDVETAVAWINGQFYFKSADLQMVLRQIARWYDVEFAYEGNVHARFSGSVYRSHDFNELLKIIAFTSNVKFTVNQKTITVSPK